MRISDWSSDVCSSDLETYAASSTWVACRADNAASGNCDELQREDYGQDPYYLVPNSYIFRQISETDKRDAAFGAIQWRPSDQFRSEEHTSELQSLMRSSYAVFCLKKKTTPRQTRHLATAQLTVKDTT